MNEVSERLLAGPLREMEPLDQEIFQIRLAQGLGDVIRPLRLLYGDRDDFDTWLGHLLEIVGKAYAARPLALRHLDLERVHQPDWFQQAYMMGYVCYTERFAHNLQGVSHKIDYLKELLPVRPRGDMYAWILVRGEV